MNPFLIRAFACLLAWLAVSAPAIAADIGFATVLRVSGTVTATSADATVVRTLRQDDAIYAGERVQAQPGAEALLQTADSGYVAVRPSAAFVVEHFSAEKKSTDHVYLRIIRGGLRLVTGWIGKLNPKEVRVITTNSTIGIRGTDHEPYFVTEELALDLKQPAGTYDKVNSGGTALETSGNSVDIDPGKVGFSKLTKPAKTRALITLVLPVILDKIPDFYVAGQFDAELDRLTGAITADPQPITNTAATTSPTLSAVSARRLPATLKNGQCNANGVAQGWLKQLDSAMARRDTSAVLRLFAAEVSVQATVMDKTGTAITVDMARDEFVQSAVTSLASLTEYQQRRLSVSGAPASKGNCKRVDVTSLVLEKGKQNGAPYRFESVEQFQLELRDGFWLAIQAHTRQR
jgi:hypothetical protein